VVESSWSVSSPLASTSPYHGVLQSRFDCPSSLEFQREFKPELALALALWRLEFGFELAQLAFAQPTPATGVLDGE